MSERPQVIVIVGAGIAGLTSALAITAAGYRVIIAERAAELVTVGAGIQLGPNAGRILADLGLDAEIAARAMEPAALEVRSSRGGDVVTSLPASAFRERYGFPHRVIHRADLQQILTDAVRTHPSITLELGATVSQFLPNADGLLTRLETRHGIDVVPAAAIIGADGVWSGLREHVPGSARPQATGRTAWRATLPADIAADLVAMDRTGLWLGPEAHLVHYPVAQGAAVNLVAIVREAFDRKGWSAAGERAEMARHFHAWPAAARRLLAAPTSWQKFPLLTVDPAAVWTSGRLALIGDAAHAMLPFLAQGAAMAIEDAAVLGRTLATVRDIPAALEQYAAARRERVRKVADASRDTGVHYHHGGLVAFGRDAALKLAGPRLILTRNDWIYRWRPGEEAGGSA